MFRGLREPSIRVTIMRDGIAVSFAEPSRYRRN